jgi:serine protease Do
MRTTIGLTTLLLALTLSQAQAQSPDDIARVKARETARMAVIDRVSKCFVAIGGGSGIIVSADGEILTNHHVAGSRPIGSTWIVVRPGGKFQKAKILGTDPRGDITFLKMIDPGPYPYVELGDSDAIQTGQAVIALGNPFGFSKDGTPNVTTGLISAAHRYQGGYSDAIQTDAAINPGNSGGPLLDMKGRLLGINGRIAVRFGTRANTGIGYAIPANQIRSFIPHFRRGGKISHGVLRGVRLGETAKGGDGAVIKSVRSGSVALAAGFRKGDRIVEAGDRKVHNARRFNGIVGTYPAGEEITVRLVRNGSPLSLTVALEPRDNYGSGPSKGGYLGVRLSTHADGGAEIEEVVAGSPAAQAGLQTGDVVKRIDGRPVKDVPALIKQLKTYKPGQTLRLHVLRNSLVVRLQVKLGKKK